MKINRELTVLIIEDDSMFRNMAFEVFDGFNRIMAKDANEGYIKFREYNPDITLLDIGLPDKSGLVLLKELMGHNPDSFIVMLTGSNLKSDVDNAINSGAAGYISKPFSYKKIEDCITMFHEHKDNLSAMIPEDYEKHFNKYASEETKKEHSSQESQEEDKEDKIIYETMKEWNILFVDDHDVNRERAGKKLANLGCKIETAASAKEAIKKASDDNYNLIFMDSKMPDTDGFDAAKIIRDNEKKSGKESIIIAMLENGHGIQEKSWKEYGMNDFVMKPSQFWQLRKMIEKYIELELKQPKKKAIKHANNNHLESLLKDFEIMAHVTSHTLRDPLRQALIDLEELEKKTQDKLITNSKDNIKKVIEGISLLREYSHLAKVSDKKDFTQISCDKILEKVKNDLSGKINKAGVKINNSKLPVITAQPQYIEKLFFELIDNAIKFSKKEASITISSSEDNDYWKFSIQDNGCGLDNVYRDFAFALFQQLEPETTEGQGCGLAFARKIVEIHDGEIKFESDGENGCIFIFTIAK